MRILARYIAGQFFLNFLMSSVGLTLVVFLQAVLGQVLQGLFPIHQILVYQSMDLTNGFVQMMPPAVLIATVLTLTQLVQTQELVACFSLGVGLRALVGMLLPLVFMLCCVSLILQDRILPPMYRNRTMYFWHDMKKRTDFYLDLRFDKIWYRSKDLIYNLRTFDPFSQRISGIAVYAFTPDFSLKKVTEAAQAEYKDDHWLLREGTEVTFEGQKGDPKVRPFETMELRIPETPKDFKEIEKEVDGLRLKQLYQYIEKTRRTGVNPRAYEVKLHSRLNLSFLPLVMCLIGIPFSIRSRREGGAARNFALCLGATFFYWIFHSIGMSLALGGDLPPVVGAWLPSIVFLILALGLITRKQDGKT